MIPAPENLRDLLPPGQKALRVLPLHGDGSARRFFRIVTDEDRYVLLEGQDQAENAAYVRIARHLESRGVRVPRVHGSDRRRGWILLEDLGDRSLLSALRKTEGPEEILALYDPVLGLLCRLQVSGAEGFHSSLGYAGRPYGPDLMVKGEGLYFAREFADQVLGLEPPAGFLSDLERLARLGAEAPACYLLHRDFQSRNVHLTPAGPAAIDFQGARFGPLAYDAAALILDPYAGLPREVRSALRLAYRARLGRLGVDTEEFEDAWFALGTFRLLQALGAFGKLGGRLGKPDFLEHAAKGLDTLLEHLGERGQDEVRELWAFVARCREAWGDR